MRQYATKLYERRVLEFMDQQAAPTTQEDLPFFVPVSIEPNEAPERKFAFLEGKGEWYQPSMGTDSPHQPFQGEIEGLLKHFNEPLTVIYIAPFTTEGYRAKGDKEAPDSRELKARDLGLLGAMEQYQNARRANFHNDSHLFLMTKWDIRCTGIADRDLLRPSDELLERIIYSRYPLSYTAFQNMNFGATKSRKSISQYSSGIIDGSLVLAPAELDQVRLDHFPRKIWNWLYFNASTIPLYKDVHPKPPSIIDKILKMLRG